MSWRPFDSGRYGYTGAYYSAAAGYCGNFANEVTWSCWARFIGAGTGGDEFIFGSGSYYNFARRTSDNMIYSHVSDGGSHSFQNYTTIGADPGNWYHLLGIWNRPSTFDHQFAINGSLTGTGTTLVNPGGAKPMLFAYDSNIEIAHAAVWATGFSSAEAAIAYKYDPLTFKPNYLRGYWPMARGAEMRQMAPRSGPGSGADDFMLLYGSSGIQPILTDDGPPLSRNWERLAAPLPSVVDLVQGAAAFIPSAVLV